MISPYVCKKMADCNFSLPFSGDPETLLNKVKSAIEKQGGSFDGDATSGNFSVKVMSTISGTYNVSGNTLSISINSKPIFISCNQIESFMKSQFIG